MPSELPFYMRRIQNFKDEVFDLFGSSGKSWVEDGLLYLLTEISYLDISYRYLVQLLSEKSFWNLNYGASICDHFEKLTFHSVTAEPTITPVSQNFVFEEQTTPSSDQYLRLYK